MISGRLGRDVVIFNEEEPTAPFVLTAEVGASNASIWKDVGWDRFWYRRAISCAVRAFRLALSALAAASAAKLVISVCAMSSDWIKLAATFNGDDSVRVVIRLVAPTSLRLF